jgi:hypothetical protein
MWRPGTVMKICLIERKFFPEFLFVILPFVAELFFEKGAQAVIPAQPGAFTLFLSLENIV